MTGVTSRRGTCQENGATFSLNLIKWRVFVFTELIIDGSESEKRNSDVLRKVIYTHMFIIIIHILISEHLDIDVLVDVVQPSLILFENSAQLLIFFLLHHAFELGKLILSNVFVKSHTNDPLVDSIKVCVEEVMAFLYAPWRGVNSCSIKHHACLFPSFTKVHTQNISAKACTEAVEACAFDISVWITHVLFMHILYCGLNVFPRA